MNLSRLISVARGESEADLILRDARIVNTFTREIEQADVAIHAGTIAGIGDYSKARATIDLQGAFLAPGLINGHTHIESSMLHPARYAEAVLARGTLAVVSDLHEIASVCGLEGITFVMNWMQRLPIDLIFMAPSCVPATHLETSGAQIGFEMVRRLLAHQNVNGLGEVMNFPGVIGGDPSILRKIGASRRKVIDGHAPGLAGKNLNAYLCAGIGSEHEATTPEEGKEKLRRGMHLMIREGSSEKNLDALLPLVTDSTYQRCFFVVDDRSCSDLLREGDVDAVVRKAIYAGLEPVRAIQMATINTARYFRLHDRGAVAPGYRADLITITDLTELEIDMVFHHGRLVARRGRSLFPLPRVAPELTDTVRMKPIAADLLSIRPKESGSGEQSYPVIKIVPGQIITRRMWETIKVVDGVLMPDVERDILKLVVVERHNATGNIGLGLVRGFGLKKGALASSVAHDSHNVIAVGTHDGDILRAIEEVGRLQGGLVVCADGEILASLPLPIAGLLSPEPLVTVVSQYEQVEKVAAGLGELPQAPFAILSFLALPVIPELRLTDLGLVDVIEFKLIR